MNIHMYVYTSTARVTELRGFKNVNVYNTHANLIILWSRRATPGDLKQPVSHVRIP